MIKPVRTKNAQVFFIVHKSFLRINYLSTSIGISWHRSLRRNHFIVCINGSFGLVQNL